MRGIDTIRTEDGVQQVTVVGTAANDTLRIDLGDSGELPEFDVVFEGGGQLPTGIGDVLEMAGTGFDEVTHTFVNENDGSVVVKSGGATRTVTYTGLEPIVDTVAAKTRRFEFTGASETISIRDDGLAGNGRMIVDSTLGESVNFAAPLNGLIELVSTGTGPDTWELLSVDSGYTGEISVTGGAGDDHLVVDFSGGNPIPGRGLSFTGGAHSANGDTVQLRGGAAGMIEYRLFGPGDGEILLGLGGRQAPIALHQAESISDDLWATNRVFTFDTTAQTITLADGSAADDGRMHVSSSSTFDVEFTSPSGRVFVNGGGGNDLLTAASLDSLFSGSIVLNGGSGDDSISAAGISTSSLIVGGGGNDNLTGSEWNDTIVGGAGNDTASGLGGDDYVWTGSGNDEAHGGDGSDTIRGGSDDDLLTGDTGNDVILGESGNDHLIGGEEDDWLHGGAGSDSFEGGEGYDTMLGGSGGAYVAIDFIDGLAVFEAGDRLRKNGEADRIRQIERLQITGDAHDDVINTQQFSGNVTLIGGDGNDLLLAGGGDDRLEGGAGEDTMSGGSRFDTLEGGSGVDLMSETNISFANVRGGKLRVVLSHGTNVLNDVEQISLEGTAGGDGINLSGYMGAATVSAGEGDDTVTGSQTADLILGGLGNDRVFGGGGNDSVSGGDGNDAVGGNAGQDILIGGAGNDTVQGGSGNDTATGGTGADSVDGGTGADFLAGSAGNNTPPAADPGDVVTTDMTDTVDETFAVMAGWGDSI